MKNIFLNGPLSWPSRNQNLHASRKTKFVVVGNASHIRSHGKYKAFSSHIYGTKDHHFIISTHIKILCIYKSHVFGKHNRSHISWGFIENIFKDLKILEIFFCFWKHFKEETTHNQCTSSPNSFCGELPYSSLQLLAEFRLFENLENSLSSFLSKLKVKATSKWSNCTYL